MNLAPSQPSVLIADNHAGIRRLIRQVCQGVVGECFESASGAEAVAAFIEHGPDWVVMDLSAPAFGGFDAARAMLERAPDARIVLISQLADPELHDQALQAGAVEFIGKDELSRLVEIIQTTPLPR